FFFADYQGSRFDQPATSSGFSVLTTAERAGDFSQLLSLPTPVQLYNPKTHTPIANNNLAAAGLVSPQASAIVNSSLYPQPINGSLTNNAFNTTHSYTNQDQGDFRLDWNASDKDHFFTRYSQSHIENPTTNSIALLYNSNNVYPLYNGVMDYTRSFSPSFVNEVRGGVNYSPIITGTLSGTGITAASVGIPDVPSDILPGMVFNGGYASGIGNAYILQSFADTVIQGEDTAIITKGTHTMRAGFQAFRERINTYYSGNAGIAGQFGFNGQYTVAPTAGAVESPEADFMIGMPENVQHGISE